MNSLIKELDIVVLIGLYFSTFNKYGTIYVCNFIPCVL